jgi:hypothetical protein
VKRYFLIVVAAAALGVVVSAASLAGARTSTTPDSTPTLSGPTTASVGGTYTVTGSGFVPGSLVPLEIAEANGCCIALNRFADASGNFSYTGDVYAPGSYQVRAWVPRNSSGRWRLAASWSFEASR